MSDQCLKTKQNTQAIFLISQWRFLVLTLNKQPKLPRGSISNYCRHPYVSTADIHMSPSADVWKMTGL